MNGRFFSQPCLKVPPADGSPYRNHLLPWRSTWGAQNLSGSYGPMDQIQDDTRNITSTIFWQISPTDIVVVLVFLIYASLPKGQCRAPSYGFWPKAPSAVSRPHRGLSIKRFCNESKKRKEFYSGLQPSCFGGFPVQNIGEFLTQRCTMLIYAAGWQIVGNIQTRVCAKFFSWKKILRVIPAMAFQGIYSEIRIFWHMIWHIFRHST